MTKSRPSAIPQPATFPTSSDPDFDFLVIGSGFAGSLIATILKTQGRRVAIVDRSSHPRFAIGESSTPAASLILSSLAEQYDLPWLKPFAKYGTWKATYPDMTTGRKRGFSYFQHEPGKPFQPRADHSNELLAAASSSDELSDTQWLRSDVDAFFFKQACESGVALFENCEVSKLVRCYSGWSIELLQRSNSLLHNVDFRVHSVPLAPPVLNSLSSPNVASTGKPSGTLSQQSSKARVATPRTLTATFVIDASGSGQVLAHHLNIPNDTQKLATNSRAIFGHVTDLPEWSKTLESSFPSSTNDYPFNPDYAAQHHVLEEGWMWWLRFDSDVTSVGLVLDDRSSGNPERLDAEAEFHEIISRYPSLKTAFASANFTNTPSMPICTKRLQRLTGQIAGNDWAMLPHTAGFIDPLHSTGIAHSLSGVERLATILLARKPTADTPASDPMLQLYASTIREELTLIDQLVAGCYNAIAEHSFRKLAAFTMCYFAAATTWERQRLNDESTLTSNSSPNLKTRSISEGQDSAPTGSSNPSLTRRVTKPSSFERPALFCADNHAFRKAVIDLRARLPHETDESFEKLCQETLAPFNHVGLFEPPIPNMYGATALQEH